MSKKSKCRCKRGGHLIDTPTVTFRQFTVDFRAGTVEFDGRKVRVDTDRVTFPVLGGDAVFMSRDAERIA